MSENNKKELFSVYTLIYERNILDEELLRTRICMLFWLVFLLLISVLVTTGIIYKYKENIDYIIMISVIILLLVFICLSIREKRYELIPISFIWILSLLLLKFFSNNKDEEIKYFILCMIIYTICVWIYSVVLNSILNHVIKKKIKNLEKKEELRNEKNINIKIEKLFEYSMIEKYKMRKKDKKELKYELRDIYRNKLKKPEIGKYISGILGMIGLSSIFSSYFNAIFKTEVLENKDLMKKIDNILFTRLFGFLLIICGIIFLILFFYPDFIRPEKKKLEKIYEIINKLEYIEKRRKK